MRSAANTRNKVYHLFVIAIATAFSVLMVSTVIYGHAVAQTTVGATVCTEGSSITLNEPKSDSVLTSPTVPVSGTVKQASQIEVYVDDAFDGVIPLDMGQTSFSGTVQIGSGTHTITVVALDMCSGPNDTASAVVTFTPPPQKPSTGAETPTTAGGVVAPGASSVESIDDNESRWGISGQIENLMKPLESVTAWLNIDMGGEIGLSQGMPVGRAVTVTTGMYLLVVGIAPAALQWVGSLPVVTQALPSMSSTGRVRLFSRFGRIVGLLLTLGALFL